MSECIRCSYDDALYKLTYTLLYFTLSCVVCMLPGENTAMQYVTQYLKHCFPLIPEHCIGSVKLNNCIACVSVIVITFLTYSLLSKLVHCRAKRKFMHTPITLIIILI